MKKTQIDEMSVEEFSKFVEKSAPRYARDVARSRNFLFDEGLQLARKQFSELLPEGMATPSNYFFTVRDANTGARAGDLWFAVRDAGTQRSTAFLFEIFLEEEFRGRGFGTELLHFFEERAQALGARELGLNVFAFNPGAQRLYERMGWTVQSSFMRKSMT